MPFERHGISESQSFAAGISDDGFVRIGENATWFEYISVAKDGKKSSLFDFLI